MSKRGLVRACMLTSIASVVAGCLCLSGPALAQFAPRDPGVRDGGPGAGGPLGSVGGDPGQNAFFTEARDVFNEIDSVSGTIAGEDGKGLGPRFNHNSCGACHIQPATGGSSPAINTQPDVAVLD